MKYILLATLFVAFALAGTAEAGCFPREDIATELTVVPNLECLHIRAGSGCIGNVELEIANYCDETLVYKGDDPLLIDPILAVPFASGGKVELYSYDEWLEIIQDDPDTYSTYSMLDRGIPQEYVNWSRELYYKNDPAKKILIEAKNIRVVPPVYRYMGYIGIALAVAILFYITAKRIVRSPTLKQSSTSKAKSMRG